MTSSGETPAAAGGLRLAQAGALCSVALIAVFSLTADSPSGALSAGVSLSLPYLGLFALLAFSHRGPSMGWGLELARIGSVVGLVFFAMLGVPVIFRGDLPRPIAVVLGLFPLAQLGLGLGAARAQRRFQRPTPHRALRLLSGLAIIAYPILVLILLPRQPHRSSNDSAAVSDVRSMISAQAAHQSAVGWYGALECLSRPPERSRSGDGPDPEAAAGPRDCADSPIAFVDERMTRSVRGGYRFELHGLPVEGREGLLSGFAYTAVPLDTRAFPGWRRTGRRSYCGDATGRVCAIEDGTPPTVENGLCALSCTDLR